MRERCENCRFWRGPTGDKYERECRRFPPQVIRFGQLGSETLFPHTQQGDWCGEFVSKTQALDEAMTEEQRDPNTCSVCGIDFSRDFQRAIECANNDCPASKSP